MNRYSKTSLSYLRRHYFDDEKLRELALSEFVRAVRAGRLVAFTGSMTTAPYEYPSWDDLLEDASKRVAKKIAESDIGSDQREKLYGIQKSFDLAKEEKINVDARVAFSVGAQMLDDVKSKKSLNQKIGMRIAQRFQKPGLRSSIDENFTPISAILDDLKIKRIVTTNYDFELEYRAMELVDCAGEKKRRPWKAIRKRIKFGEFELAGRKREGYSMAYSLPNGDRIASDIMMRNQPEGLLELAIGSTSFKKHIFHIHGRADVPDEMIVSYRDYDRLYRRNGLGKVPFEHGLRTLLAGNPVLFAGLGMSEPELNATLEEFVGSDPFVKKAPAFLIWNAPKSTPKMTIEQRKTVFRLDKLHRLGVLTIFADEIRDKNGKQYFKFADGTDPKSQWKNLQRALKSLAKYAIDQQKKRVREIPSGRWRNSFVRTKTGFTRKNGGKTGSIINTWSVDWVGNDEKIDETKIPSLEFSKGEVIRVDVRSNGTSKTKLASHLAEKWKEKSAKHLAIVVNFNMRIDTDSILELLALSFRFDPRTHEELEDTRVETSREDQFQKLDQRVADGRETLIILKGIERIFDVNGNPLSAEFDQFLRTIIARYERHNIKIVVLGTDRVLPYFKAWKDELHREFGSKCKAVDCDTTNKEHSVNSAYLKKLSKKNIFPEMNHGIPGAALKNKRSGDYATLRRRAYEIIINRKALGKSHRIDEPDLALDILSIMSFVGQPLEPAVLFHAPKIRAALALDAEDTNVKEASNKLRKCLEQMEALFLVREVNRRNGEKPESKKRFAVHLSLQAEMRDRHAIPLSDSILSTAYNMSLFCAQPADAALPDPELHDELGYLVDWLTGAYKDTPFVSEKPDGSPEGAVKNKKWQPHVVSSLRAAFAIVRGLYSTSALLSLDRGDRLVSNERDGALSEHAERLGRIIKAFAGIWDAREKEKSKTEDMGPEVFYPDEIVWLHNERGVVKLAQGDLYEARFSFDEAERVNLEYVEFHSKSHNWRRISINQLVVDIERGKLQCADDRMTKIETALGIEKTRHIRQKYLKSKSTIRIRFDAKVSHEDILVMALITGYRGLTAHLNGELDQARQHFKRSINVLQRMDEQRALALFRRHYASLLMDIGDMKKTRKESRFSAANAESGRQLDIAYAARLVEACAAETSGSAEDLRHGLQLASSALEYATLTDMHRLTVEAQARLARSKLTSGDLDAAMEHASEAIAVATRYGMSLYKVSLRTLIGQVLIERGNKNSGKVMIDNAIREAVRIGYQRAVESARRVQGLQGNL